MSDLVKELEELLRRLSVLGDLVLELSNSTCDRCDHYFEHIHPGAKDSICVLFPFGQNFLIFGSPHYVFFNPFLYFVRQIAPFFKFRPGLFQHFDQSFAVKELIVNVSRHLTLSQMEEVNPLRFVPFSHCTIPGLADKSNIECKPKIFTFAPTAEIPGKFTIAVVAVIAFVPATETKCEFGIVSQRQEIKNL